MINYNYVNKLEKLKNRRTDIELITKLASEGEILKPDYLLESYEKSNEKDIYKYFLGAMQAVDSIYTRNTFIEAERVQNQLDKIKCQELNFVYRYQGSVSNNTHIKAHSDIDILVIINKFFTLEHPQIPQIPYQGNPIEDLYDLRIKCEEHLKEVFYAVDVDCTGAKSISMEGGSLKRKVDIVPSNWFDTNKYAQTLDGNYRGIQILEKYKRERILNMPFYHNLLLNEKESRCQNNYKKLVRLLKTLKADANIDIDFSSYDITGLIYNMNDSRFIVGSNYLVLLRNLKAYIKYVLNNSIYRDQMYVPDKSRKVFDGNHNKVIELNNLKKEIDTLYNEIYMDLENSDFLLENKNFAM